MPVEAQPPLPSPALAHETLHTPPFPPPLPCGAGDWSCWPRETIILPPPSPLLTRCEAGDWLCWPRETRSLSPPPPPCPSLPPLTVTRGRAGRARSFTWCGVVKHRYHSPFPPFPLPPPLSPIVGRMRSCWPRETTSLSSPPSPSLHLGRMWSCWPMKQGRYHPPSLHPLTRRGAGHWICGRAGRVKKVVIIFLPPHATRSSSCPPPTPIPPLTRCGADVGTSGASDPKPRGHK